MNYSQNYSLKSFEIIPTRISRVNSRKDCNTRYPDEKLPVFISPMTCLTDENNYQEWESAGFRPIIPRLGRLSFEAKTQMLKDGKWVAFGLSDVDDLKAWLETATKTTYNICIDVACGNMSRLLDAVDVLKSINPWIVIMTGNIANPETYIDYAFHGVDYVRIGIGGGHVCTTSEGSGVHYAMGSLIQEVYKIKREIQVERFGSKTDFKSIPKIIVDGGIDGTADINLALALGADYVMIGYMAAQVDTICSQKNSNGDHLYYGMSTVRAQKEFGRTENFRISQGTERWVTPIYSNPTELANEIEFWLSEAMSETGHTRLYNYIGTPTVAIRSMDEYYSYHKEKMNV